jgi:hypothetical protein
MYGVRSTKFVYSMTRHVFVTGQCFSNGKRQRRETGTANVAIKWDGPGEWTGREGTHGWQARRGIRDRSAVPRSTDSGRRRGSSPPIHGGRLTGTEEEGDPRTTGLLLVFRGRSLLSSPFGGA